MIGKISRLLSLPRAERRVLLQALLLLPLFWAGLRALGLPRLHAWATSSSARASRTNPTPQVIGALVAIAGNHQPFPSTCLTRSLLLVWLLGRRGMRADLRIGVRMLDGRLDAHAWVECDGRPLNDAPDVAERFAAFEGPLPPGSFSSP